jgi:hypothetical protein
VGWVEEGEAQDVFGRALVQTKMAGSRRRIPHVPGALGDRRPADGHVVRRRRTCELEAERDVAVDGVARDGGLAPTA